MSVFKPFKAYRPSPKYAKEVASKPYDVLNSKEARIEAEGHEMSFLHVVKPEIDLPEDVDPYSHEVYLKGKANFNDLITKGVFIQDSAPMYYIYRLTMNGRTQTGLVGCCFFEEYFEGIIKKHELTRTAKENDRVNHVECLNANAEPVFFSYRGNDLINNLVANEVGNDPLYNFLTDDGVRHELWSVVNPDTLHSIETAFENVSLSLCC